MVHDTPDTDADGTHADTRPSRRKNIMHYLKEYCSKATFHGIHYLGEEKRVIAERVWWSIFITASMSACIYMIIQIYLKWVQSPVLVSFATQQTPFYDIPFPAITICSKANIDLINPECINIEDYMNKTENQQPVTAKEEKYAAYMQLLCQREISENTNKTIDFHDFYKFLKDCAPKRKAKIIFKNEYFAYEFKELFKPTLTAEGICYTFNRLNWDEMFTKKMVKPVHQFEDFPASEWNSETGYSKTAPVEAYPKRGLLTDVKYGLGVFLFEDRRNKDYYCDPIMQGYTVSLHIPTRPAKTKEEFFFVPFESAVLVPVRAKVTHTSQAIKNYRPEKRNCYFPSEKKLVYFKEYTQGNCYLECMAEDLLRTCGCVKFFMPRNATTEVCGPGASNCTDVYELEEKYDELDRELAIEHGILSKEEAKKTFDMCRCRPMCNDIAYLTEPAHFDINATRILAWMENEGVVDINTTTDPNLMTTYIMLYLKDRFIETTFRNELYGPQDLLSNFGGLLGLFTGFSMLSLIEIIYFLSLRLCANVHIHGNWAGIAKNT